MIPARLPAFVIAAAFGVAACSFEPGGEGASGDAPPGDDDAPAADAPVVDAPGPDVDAAVIDARIIDARIIDAPPIDAPPPVCPTSYDVVVGTSRYRFVTGVQPLGNAIADCANDVAGISHLATFEAAADLETVHAGRGGNEMFWVHATCSVAPSAPCNDPASWRWQPDGEAVAPTLWGGGEPNNPTFERNAISFKENGDWMLNNVVASEVHAYVCECGD